MNRKVLPSTSKRVKEQTNPCVNNEIRNGAANRITAYKDTTAEILCDKIKTLDDEWDIERILETNAGALVLICSVMGLRRSKLFLLTGIVGFFLLQHSLFGWCPPLPLLRSLGIRTAEEIYNEKTAMKIARKDFEAKPETATEMLNIAEK
ncbi:MAG: DUF2892 domain-containing protein [Eubacteriales bacterium]|nr:DUF2892 domain-containing protein [Eubacteriales bacterium]MDD4421901.1 DUF2892 domain-containing protein [Eubacteriales bacterium]HBR31860.1 DUF2892 domain-containing protein [Clostridiales bacterium]